MTQHTLNGKIILVAEVPDDARHLCIHLVYLAWRCGGLWSYHLLPAGSWELLGRLSEINGVKAANLVHSFPKTFGGVIQVCYYDYEHPLKNETNPIINPIASLYSWGRSKGIADNSVLLVKK
jgi:hypothetical protein